MAILNMFAAVFLVVIHGSQAQNLTNVTVVMNATIGSTLQSSFNLPQSSFAAFPKSTVVAVVMSFSPAISNMSKPASYGVSATPSLTKNNAASSTGLKSTPSTPGISKTPSKGVPSPTMSSVVLSSACKELVSHSNLTGEELRKAAHQFPNRKCSNPKNCCKGLGKTNITLKPNVKNCEIHNFTCINLAEFCKCQAGFLSASFFTIAVGMFFYLFRS